MRMALSLKVSTGPLTQELLVKKFVLILMFLFSSTLFAETMKIEGFCTSETSGSWRNFKYYSTFNGCRSKSSAAISNADDDKYGPDVGLYTGTRTLSDTKDTYSVTRKVSGRVKEIIRLVFANSTGNTTGSLTYYEGSKKQTITVRCDVRDYEYAECN